MKIARIEVLRGKPANWNPRYESNQNLIAFFVAAPHEYKLA
jgi:hypothetical protein